MELFAVLAAVTVVSAVMSWSSYRAASEAEATIRLAIEKGLLTDAMAIRDLRQPAGLSWVERLTVLGMLVLFASAGLVVGAVALIVLTGGRPAPLFALAAFSAALGLGLVHCGRWVRRTRARP
ncbi:hypothetical protein [Phenylobacterium sp.]|uniref:hypothetical protein n=1 Tax=Phenylobacterium sp. TaxID=1871053 RepID=UPI0025F3DD2D|nr:hypothetical protein [Phenylobacterium sp.]